MTRTVVVMSSQVVVLQLVVLMSICRTDVKSTCCAAVLRQLHRVLLARGSLCVLVSDCRSSLVVWRCGRVTFQLVAAE